MCAPGFFVVRISENDFRDVGALQSSFCFRVIVMPSEPKAAGAGLFCSFNLYYFLLYELF